MREIVVLSGKGGTGKTTLSASFAKLAKNALLCDLDVDAPNFEILLQPEVQTKTRFISGNEAKIDPDNCIDCGQCIEFCRFDAIEAIGGGAVKIKETLCEGCGVCVTLCPSSGIVFPSRDCGEWYFSKTRYGELFHAQLNPGQENSGRLVSLLKEKAREKNRQTPYDILLCDGSPGVGCPVIASLSGAHLAVAVVEPTASGVSDFSRLLALANHFRVPVAVVINKADLSPEGVKAIEDLAQEKGASVVGKLPFSDIVPKALTAGKILTEIPGELSQEIERAWNQITNLAKVGQKDRTIPIRAI